MEGRPLSELQRQLRESFTAALKAKDAVATAALRSALAAIDNAAAVDSTPGSMPALGVGTRDFARKELSPGEVREIVRREVSDREAAAIEYETRAKNDQARRLRAEAAVLAGLLD